MPDWFWPKSTEENGVIVRIGRSLHWLGYGAAALLLALMAIALSLWFTPTGPADLVEPLLWALGFAVAGRLARYIIANE